MDSVTVEQRSLNMSRIRSRDTAPEIAVRQLAHRLGFRFRLYRRDLPGNPDLTFPMRRKVIFVNGCFWHRHARCKFATQPKSNVAYWRAKFRTTVRRDRRTRKALEALGWEVLTVWQCEISSENELRKKLATYLKAVPIRQNFSQKL
jgi:DNA mismatch endonuclease (patch repair protein)